MYSEINKKMEVLLQGIARLQKIDGMTSQLRKELSALQEKENELKAILEKENHDLTRLENRSIASVFYSIVGSLEKHIEKEQREALAAKLKYDKALKDIEDVEYRLSKLSSERREYANYQAEYDRLFEQKKSMLMSENVEAAQRILTLTKQIDSLKIRVNETREAVSAGNAVIDSLDSVLRSLDSAEGWGTWDIFGGGLISDIEKHANIDEAKIKIENTQMLLRNFNTELADVKISSNIDIRIDGFSKFADFFFDGLFADLNMQSMIGESQSSVLSVKGEVYGVIDKLENMEASDAKIIEELTAELSTIVTRS